MANAVKFNRVISDINRNKAMNIYEIVCENNIELLAEADELTEQEKRNRQQKRKPLQTQTTA